MIIYGAIDELKDPVNDNLQDKVISWSREVCKRMELWYEDFEFEFDPIA